MSFKAIGLSDSIMRGVSSSGYTTPTEIQRQAIPLAMQGKDIIGCAPTGTGKTAAFVLPILHRLHASSDTGVRKNSAPRALILTPTRELAVQIEKSILTYGKHTELRPIAVYGGVDINAQLRGLRHGADVVVATPGRLLDHLERRSVDLSRVEILVLDEADRMFDMGFIIAVRRIISHVPANRQTLLFSATMSREVCSLASGIQKQPLMVDLGQSSTPAETVEQEFYTVSQLKKTDLLVHILQNEDVETMLVFSRTKHGADRISKRLSVCGISSEAIHSNRSQSQRQNALDGFRQRKFKVLVATDVAARGIDVHGISHVVNFDTPAFPEDYIHRIGRTGRAEASGKAFTFVSDDEKSHVRKIEHLTGKRFEVKRYPGFAYPAEVKAPELSPTLSAQASRFRRSFGRSRSSFGASRVYGMR